MRHVQWKFYGTHALWNLNELKAPRVTSGSVEGLHLRTTSLSNVYVVDITYKPCIAGSALALKFSLLNLLKT
jgi:ABC-type transport system involved in cytochrome c biogenesis permease component